MPDNLDENMIELLDENDNPVMFEFIHTMEHDGCDYVVLAPAEEDDPDDEETGVVILKVVVTDVDEQYEDVEDEELLDQLFAQFVAEMEELEQFEAE